MTRKIKLTQWELGTLQIGIERLQAEGRFDTASLAVLRDKLIAATAATLTVEG